MADAPRDHGKKCYILQWPSVGAEEGKSALGMRSTSGTMSYRHLFGKLGEIGKRRALHRPGEVQQPVPLGTAFSQCGCGLSMG